jgi:outer membrane receptor for ferrienterochelin and colicins
LLKTWYCSFVFVIASVQAAPQDFSLPSLDGKQFIVLSAQKRPVLVSFFSVECPPCVAELPQLIAFAETQQDWQVILVTTDKLAMSRAFFARYPVPFWVLRPPISAQNLLRRLGNPLAALPFSVAFNSDGRCASQLGVLNIEALLLACMP